MRGRLDAFRATAEHSPLQGADFHVSEDRDIYYTTGIDYAPMNGIITEEETRVPSEQQIKKSIEFFQKRKLPFIWWTGAKNLEKYGFQFGGILTGIVLDISRKDYSEKISSGIKIKRVQSNEDMKIFAKIAVEIFGIDPGSLEHFQIVNTEVMKHYQQVSFLAFVDEKPVGTVSLSTSVSSSGIWNLATLSEYRKHGIGTALVKAALLEAKERKYGQVMAILMPKGMAWGLFAKLGYKKVCHFPFYVYGVRADELEK